jgi:hypothetical protein
MTNPTCNGCRVDATDATHTCRAYGWPPVKTYGCTVREIERADDEGREAMRQLMWAAFDQLTIRHGGEQS